MSFPSIPGYTAPPKRNTLASLWTSPNGDFPQVLWPTDDLHTVSQDPTGWITVEQNFFNDEKHGGQRCVLVRPEQAEQAIQDTTWTGHSLGTVSLSEDGFDDGLTVAEKDAEIEFFIGVSKPSGASQPVVDISLPFLWYWDAFPAKDGWKYLNSAGREQDLVRCEIDSSDWKIEIRALELRQYLAESGRSAIFQLDYVKKIDSEPFERVDDEFHNNWAHFDFHVLHDLAMGARPAFSRLVGQWVLSGMANSRVPRMREFDKEHHYPDFIYGVDDSTGEYLTHTCDPDQLGTYFDQDNSRLHYLTPVYFKREVLQPYALEPNKYQIYANRLTCLDLWLLELSFNSSGLVEVYLGDLGRKLPPDEWGHWRSYNVPPEGEMEEGRFRRDFLGQWASSNDPIQDLRNARKQASEVSAQLLGSPIWKPLTGDIKAEFESLIGPLANDPASFNSPVLVLVKSLVDSIDTGPLKEFVSNREKGDQSLQLLRKFTEDLGDQSDVTSPLRALQRFRSRGGVAHLASSHKDEAETELGITGMSSLEAFKHVVEQATRCLLTIAELISNALRRSADE